MSQPPNTAIAVIGIDIGKNSFHVAGFDDRGAKADKLAANYLAFVKLASIRIWLRADAALARGHRGVNRNRFLRPDAAARARLRRLHSRGDKLCQKGRCGMTRLRK